MHAQQDLAETRQSGEGFQGLGGQRRDTENDDPGRQATGGGVQAGDGFNEPLVNTGTTLRHALFSHIQQQRTPQLGLPTVSRCQRLALASAITKLMTSCCPVFQPVRTVDLILVEQVRQALGQLIALAQIGVVGQEALQGLEVRLIDQLRQ
ncbi:hypothetical protein D3C78_856380 [compost metagenome]